MLVEPEHDAGPVHLLRDGVEPVRGVRERVPAADNGVNVGRLAGIRQHREDLVFDHVGEQVREGVRARVDYEVAFLGQQRFHQPVEFLRLDQPRGVGYRHVPHLQRLVMRERGVLLIGIEAAHGTCLVEQVLREQRAHERLAYTALGLENKVNGVLHGDPHFKSSGMPRGS